MKINNKHRFLALICAFMLLISALNVNLLVSAVPTPPANTVWDGSEKAVTLNNKTYTVSTASELYYVLKSGTLADGTIINITADIYINDTTGFANWDTVNGKVSSEAAAASLKNWDVSSFQNFKGGITINGNNHRIYGLYSKNAGGNAGLLPRSEGNYKNYKINNLGVDYAYVEGKYASAFIPEQTSNVVRPAFTNCYVGADVKLVGNDGNTSKYEESVGGFVGYMTCSQNVYAVYTNCYSLANVTATDKRGGTFVGCFSSGKGAERQQLNNCYSNSETVPLFANQGPNHTYSGMKEDYLTDEKINYAPVAWSSIRSASQPAYTTACAIADMKGVGAMQKMKELGSAYITTATYPTLACFVPESERGDNNIVFGTSLPMDTAHTAIADGNAYVSAITDENRLESQTYTASLYKDNAVVADEVITNAGINVDLGAVHSKETQINSCHYREDIANDVIQTEDFAQLQINLKNAIHNPTKFVYVGSTAKNDRASKHYAVFVSDKSETLFDADSKIIEISDLNARAGDEVDLTALDDELKAKLATVNYVGIRFYHKNKSHSKTGCSGVFVNLIGMYGGTVDQPAVMPNSTKHTVQQGKAADYVASYGTNNLAQRNYSASFYKAGALTTEKDNNGIGIDTVLGRIHGTSSNGCKIEDAPNDILQTDNFWQLQIDLGGTLEKPTEFVFFSHDTNKSLMSKHYAIFVSDDPRTLYNEENKLIEITDETARTGDTVDLTAANTDIDQSLLAGIKYVGVRFYNRAYTSSKTGCTGQQIKLMGMYGGTYKVNPVKVEYFNKVSQYTADNLAADTNTYGESLIVAKTPYLTKLNGAADVTANQAKKITDTLFDDHANIGEYKGQKDGAYDMIYKLDEDPNVIKKIDKFFLRGVCKDSAYLEEYSIGKYEVYASVNYSELFLEKNCIYDFDYERDGLQKAQAATFIDEENPVYARYVAIRIINPVADSDNISNMYPRITEMAFFGKTASIEWESQEISVDLPVEAIVTDSKGASTDISENLTAQMIADLSDQSKKAQVAFNVNNDRLDIIYNLCRDYEITKAALTVDGGASYTVYAANNLIDLYSESSKLSVGAYDGKKVNARYVRFNFAKGQGNTITIDNVSIVGYLNPLIARNEHISYSMDATKISVFEKPLAAKSGNDLSYISTKTDLLFDTDIYKTNFIQCGVKDKSTLNLLVDFSTLQVVTDIKLSFAPNQIRYQPTKVYVYFGETYDEAMDLTAKPDIVFDATNYKDGLPKNGSYEASTRPTLAKFMRIEVVENNYGKNIKNINGELDEDYFNKDNMSIAFSEIDIQGMSVLGMADENGNLLTFTDKATGIKWSIAAADENDVAPNVFSSKLVSKNVSQEQKSSLYNDPYYKVLNDKLYIVEFYDFFGNKINDIGGRDIVFTVPLNASDVADTILGDATKDSEITIYDIVADSEQNIVAVSTKYTSALKIAILRLTTEDDAYWNGIIPETDDTTDSTDDIVDTDISEDEEKTPELVATVVDLGSENKYTINYESADVWLIVLTIVQGVLLLGAIGFLVFLFIREKKKAKLLS